ncbi:hypothetical protein D6B98_33615 [Bradyrhizobium sp. LVM 105]|nr:hypothetical protein D6B98_33615 [Bradyrhizobium sp. LVM 105]
MSAGGARLYPSSLRAQRSNPESFLGGSLDCFVASLLAMTRREPRRSPQCKCNKCGHHRPSAVMNRPAIVSTPLT